MPTLFDQAFAANNTYGSSTGTALGAMGAMGVIIGIVIVVLYVLYIVQVFMGYGTAYRKTKENGDNGVSLFGWMIVYSLAAMIPGLGIYLWSKSKTPSTPTPQPLYQQAPPMTPMTPMNQANAVSTAWICPSCGAENIEGNFCGSCGTGKPQA